MFYNFNPCMNILEKFFIPYRLYVYVVLFVTRIQKYKIVPIKQTVIMLNIKLTLKFLNHNK